MIHFIFDMVTPLPLYILFIDNLQVRISSDKPEKADQLLISFNGRDAEAFQIGKITLQNDHNVRSGDLSPAGQYTAGYPKHYDRFEG